MVGSMSSPAPDTAPAPSDLIREQGLTRMRRLALAILAAMAALFLIAARLRHVHPVFGYLEAFAEAGLAGGLADWFAVTALFRRPLGLPIPHTAIIPRNRARIGRALGDFISDQLLSPDLVQAGLARFSASAALADVLAAQSLDGAPLVDELARKLARAAPGLLRAAPRHALETGLKALMQEALASAPAGQTSSAALRLFWTPERSRAIGEATLRYVASAIDSRRDALRDELAAHGGGWTPRFVDRMLADRVIGAVENLLGDLEQADHPWRLALDRSVADMADRLASDPELVARAQGWKDDLARGPALDAAARAAVDRLTRPEVANGVEDEALADLIAQALNGLIARLRTDRALSEPLDLAVQQALTQRILAERPSVSDLVTERVGAWDEATLVRALELQTGQDLQYIRINGALVGGVAGLAIHLISGLAHLR